MKSGQNDILLYVKSLTWIITPFCLLGSLHYLFVFFPRVLTNEESVVELNHLNFDYLGVIVGFFALLVTLLVGWQIYSTIKAKEELEKSKEDIEKRFNARFKELQDCCRDGKSELAKVITRINNYHEVIDKANADMRLYTKSLSDLSNASTCRQTVLILEVAWKPNFRSELYNDALYNIGNALVYANQSTIKDSINPICSELYVLTKNILDRKRSKHIDAIKIQNIDKILDEISKLNKNYYYAVGDIVKNLEEIRKLRQKSEGDGQLDSTNENSPSDVEWEEVK